MSYQRAQEPNGAARELITVLHRARQLAITRSNCIGAAMVTGPERTITFRSVGFATATGTLRGHNSAQTGCLDVKVGPSGRIQRLGSAACP
jgi:hypothetical protein